MLWGLFVPIISQRVVPKGVHMLQNTFCHIPGIGVKTETNIWGKGISNWTDFINLNGTMKPARRHQLALDTLEKSFLHLEHENAKYFETLLPSHLHWRLFPEFRKYTAYVDIETTGLDAEFNDITTISLYDGTTIKYYINGQNIEEFLDDILNYKLIISYNGKCFDIPFLERYFRTRFDHSQIDLRYVLNGLGYKGGLKKCEAQLGIDRGELSGVNGYFAVLLWADYTRNKNEKALETLLAYNIEDVVNLEALMVMAYNMNLKNTPFYNALEIDLPTLPNIPFQPDLETIDRLKYPNGIT